MSLSFCAICTSERGPFVSRPLGKNDALVAVCAECDEEPMHVRLGPERGYEIREGVSAATIRERASRLIPNEGWKRMDFMFNGDRHDRTPGWILVRVPIKDALGKPRDFRAILTTLRDKPWFRELRMLGNTRTHFLFERPDPKVAAAQRTRSVNPIVDLEKYRS